MLLKSIDIDRTFVGDTNIIYLQITIKYLIFASCKISATHDKISSETEWVKVIFYE